MRNRKQKITSRDRMILSLLGEYGCISAGRLKSHFWKTKPKSDTHYRRIGILKKHRLIENVRGDGGITIGYRLTKKGKRFLLLGASLAAQSVLRKSYRTDFEHDQLLIDLRSLFRESPLVGDFKTEAEVRSELFSEKTKLLHWESAPTIPDATFVFKAPGHQMRVAVELELTAKVKRRYARIFRSHLLSKNWQMVIYIVKDVNFQKRLMKILSDIKERDVQVKLASTINGIYFCSLGEFLGQQLNAKLTNGKREISLSQIAQNFGLQRDISSAKNAPSQAANFA